MMNLAYIALAALVPMIIGFIYYNPKTLGTAWMNASGMTEEKMKGANMGVIFGVSLLLSFMLAFFLQPLVIHQFSIMSVLINEPGFNDPTSATGVYYNDFIAKYGNNFRTFKHGMLHGFIASLFFVLPVLGINALFERKGFKYIAINVGYWAITLMLMGGILCQFIKFPD